MDVKTMQTVLQNLSFSLNATIPVFLMMVFGGLMKKVNLLDDHTTGKLNQFVFKALLPALLFMDLSQADFRSVWDGKFVLFCFCATFLSIGIAFLLSLPRKSWSERGEIIQASYRSSAAILGIAFVNNIYGHATMAALMIVGTVPLYNVAAVLILSLTAPHDGEKPSTRKLLLRTLRDVATNPIILGILAGMLWSVLKIPQPVILQKSVSYLGNMGNAAGADRPGCVVPAEECQGQAGADAGHLCGKAVSVLRSVSAGGGLAGIPHGKAHRHSHYAGQRHHVQLLCHGKKHETRGYHHCLRRDDDHPAQCVLSDDVAVRAEEPGVYLMI